ncbi:peptidoglycan DD-metalloendopeptidase family protein [Pistricoccus aurantiacus]|uniref:peptidoglycan DD-metalloendopeptidase family protein n=1 Tax=Pistricoccus aurantiacus TaxID=1883414 RepID=UPI003A94FB6D
MMGILHSLPRTHKLLLLPVATMVTVLGAQQIIHSLETPASNVSANNTNFQLPTNARTADVLSPEVLSSGVSSLSNESPLILQRSPLAQGVEFASRALEATKLHIPLAQLTTMKIADFDFITSAHASERNRQRATFQGTPLVSIVATDTSFDATQGVLPTSDSTDSRQQSIADFSLQAALQLAYRDSGITQENFHDDDLAEDPLDNALVRIDGDNLIFLGEEIVANKAYVPRWETYEVHTGDTFAQLAQRTLGLGYSEAMALLETLPDKRALTHWRVGQRFDYKVDEQGKLLALRIMRNARDGYLVERSDSRGFETAKVKKTGEATQRLFAGTVSGSFARSAEATGLSTAEVAELSQLLAKKLNFRRDTRRGDQFEVLVESDMIEGESLDSRILAVRYRGKKDLTLVRNEADDHFYTPDGDSLDPAFNRYPFQGHYRLSSSFNLRRKHPVTGRISPHYGSDFALPVGTPVKAPAAGKVIKSVRHPLAGNYLVIQHDNGYKTRYLHLSKRQVRVGQRVEMGQQIALSGNTGRSTGPHLHYEMIVNDNRVDPLRVELPKSRNLSGQALANFMQASKPVLAQLESGRTGAVVASRSQQKARANDGG